MGTLFLVVIVAGMVARRDPTKTDSSSRGRASRLFLFGPRESPPFPSPLLRGRGCPPRRLSRRQSRRSRFPADIRRGSEPCHDVPRPTSRYPFLSRDSDYPRNDDVRAGSGSPVTARRLRPTRACARQRPTAATATPTRPPSSDRRTGRRTRQRRRYPVADIPLPLHRVNSPPVKVIHRAMCTRVAARPSWILRGRTRP